MPEITACIRKVSDEAENPVWKKQLTILILRNMQFFPQKHDKLSNYKTSVHY